MPRAELLILKQSSGHRLSSRSPACSIAAAMRAGVLLAIDKSRREGLRPGR